MPFKHSKLATLAAEGPLYLSMSGSRLRPPVITEMFRKLVSDPGRAVTADVKLLSAYYHRRGFPMETRRWYRERIDPNARPGHPSVFLGYVGSASSVRFLTITGDLLRAADQRADRFATPLSTDSVP
jgi:hypothetical protein